MKKIIFLLLFVPVVIISQELNAKVTLNIEQLPTKYKEKLVLFEQQIAEYINNTRFTGENWEWDKIQCSFNIFFISGFEENGFSAQVVITSQRPVEGTDKRSLMLNILDNSWKFRYESGQTNYFGQTDFNPLLSFIDFYAYMILGFDADSYEPLAGSNFYQKALDIAIKGSSSQYSDGWATSSATYNKRGLVEGLLNAKFGKFREDFYEYHYNGLDIFASEKNKAQANIAKMINNLFKMKDEIGARNVVLPVFFDAKSSEIVEYLKGYSDKSIFQTLQKIDPGNITKYRAAEES
ncbi:MAG: DUF4835 family protein [bacterium]